MVVTFNMADQEFEYYSEVAWEEQLNEWRAELGEDVDPDADADEIVELMYGGELCFHRVPTN